MAIETPCVQTCKLDPLTGLCLGCGRTGEEIAGWVGMSPPQRRAIMQALGERLAGLAALGPLASPPVLAGERRTGRRQG